MHSENAVFMKGNLDRIVTLASETERWPEILPHYRWVTILSGGGDDRVVEMAAWRDRIPLKWRAIQQVRRDGPTPVIHFEHIAGPTTGMAVDWHFEPQQEGVLVRISHDFQSRIPVVGGFIADRIIGPHFIEVVAGRTLATIKGIVEGRDPRFPQ